MTGNGILKQRLQIKHKSKPRETHGEIAPVFVGRYTFRTKQYTGFCETHGRVFIDSSRTTFPIQQFKTYLCCLIPLKASKSGCEWQVTQVIALHTPLKYYVMDLKIEINERDGNRLFCSHENKDIIMQKCDVKENCHIDFFGLLTLHAVCFEVREDEFVVCFASLLNEFNQELHRNASILKPQAEHQCCDDRTAKRMEILNSLVHNRDFWELISNSNPELAEKIIELFIFQDDT
ncbi:hypothetical protein Ddc_07817 [Ditylenchus destructor]|nr:hypothetical protein Ddc_07817 [Ditylenchus destructor]